MRTAMPKATVDEHCEALSAEDNVNLATNTRKRPSILEESEARFV
jgi:hypothetical protein